MKKYTLSIFLLLIFTIGYILKKERLIYYKVTGFAQGTSYMVKYGVKDSLDLSDSVKMVLDEFDLTFSSYVPNSMISAINNNDSSVILNDQFEYIFNLSKEIHEITGGAFDLTVAPLVNVWGFGWEKNETPDQMVIDSILRFVGMDKVNLKDRKVIKQDQRIQLDVNAIAQGYSVDILTLYLENLGITNYLVEIGGEVKGRGHKQNNQVWKVGVEKPEENNIFRDRPIQAAIKLKNMSLATSGNYRKFYEKDGIKFVHTINPKTGQMVKSSLLSVTVLNKECARADALATGFMVLGVEKGIELVKKLKDTEVYLIYSDSIGNYKEWNTPGFNDLIIGLE